MTTRQAITSAGPDDTADNARWSAAAARIRQAATAAFAEHGYGGASTRDIARRLGLSPAAMYPHYPSKEALLYAISLEGHHAALREVQQADDPCQAPAERLQAVVAAFTRWQAEHSALARVLQYEMHSLAHEHYGAIVGLRDQLSAVIAGVLADGRTAAAFTTTDPDVALLALLSLCVDVCRWFPSSTYSDADQLAARYADLALRIVS